MFWLRTPTDAKVGAGNFHEDVYLKGYATVGELMIGLTEYFVFYNARRPHQSLGNKTPDVVYRTAIGGGAMILDKYPRAGKDVKSETETQQAPIIKVKAEEKAKAKPGQRRSTAAISHLKLDA